MRDPSDEITKYAAFVAEKYLMPAIRASYASAVRTFAADEYNGPMTFGIQAYENRHNRFLDLARDPENPLEIEMLDGYPRIAADHVEYGLIVLFHHSVSPAEYLPNPEAAKKAKSIAIPASVDLFGFESPAMTSRFIGIVGTPTEGLQEVVVGALVQTSPDLPVFELRNRVRIYDALSAEPVELVDGVPPEPVEQPIVVKTPRADKTGDRG